MKTTLTYRVAVLVWQYKLIYILYVNCGYWFIGQEKEKALILCRSLPRPFKVIVQPRLFPLHRQYNMQGSDTMATCMLQIDDATCLDDSTEWYNINENTLTRKRPLLKECDSRHHLSVVTVWVPFIKESRFLSARSMGAFQCEPGVLVHIVHHCNYTKLIRSMPVSSHAYNSRL